MFSIKFLSTVALLGITAVFATPVVAEDRALIVGINLYPHLEDGNLNQARGDAIKFANFVHRDLGLGTDQITLLLDGNATRKNVIEVMVQDLRDNTKPGDRFIFYFSGHGYQINDRDGEEPDGKDELIVLADQGKPGSLGILLDDELRYLFERFPDRQILVVVDSCYSGTISRGAADEEDTLVRTLTELGDGLALPPLPAAADLDKDLGVSARSATLIPGQSHMDVWSAAAQDQVALENRQGGVFTRLFLEGLQQGKADRNNNGRVSNAELLTYVRAGSAAFCNGSKLCQARNNGRLTPEFGGLIERQAAFVAPAPTAPPGGTAVTPQAPAPQPGTAPEASVPADAATTPQPEASPGHAPGATPPGQTGAAPQDTTAPTVQTAPAPPVPDAPTPEGVTTGDPAPVASDTPTPPTDASEPDPLTAGGGDTTQTPLSDVTTPATGDGFDTAEPVPPQESFVPPTPEPLAIPPIVVTSPPGPGPQVTDPDKLGAPGEPPVGPQISGAVPVPVIEPSPLPVEPQQTELTCDRLKLPGGSQILGDMFVPSNSDRVTLDIAPGDILELGETVQFEVSANRPGQIVLFDLNPDCELFQIFPSFLSPDGADEFDGRRSVEIPNALSINGQPMQIRVTEPYGRGHLVALLIEDDVRLVLDTLPNFQDVAPIPAGLDHLKAIAATLNQSVNVANQTRPAKWHAAIRQYTISP